MERLTKRISGYAYGAEGTTKDNLTGHYCRGEFEATACVEKLAEYEDLEEQCIKETTFCLRMLLKKWKDFLEDIQELYWYRGLEKQNRLLKLPCANWMDIVFGNQEMFWGIDLDYIENPIREITVDSSDRMTWYRGWETVVLKGTDENGLDWEFLPAEIGNTVFLTREEAEAALKELKERNVVVAKKDYEYLGIDDYIRNQPTAFDVDKVVEQLEEFIRESNNADYNRAMFEAIEVIKSKLNTTK